MASSDSISKTVVVALGVCLVCSILVASAAVFLKPRQDANKALEKRKNILLAGDLIKEDDKGNVDIEGIFKDKVTPVLLDLKSGEIVSADNLPSILKPDNFDIKKVLKTAAVSSSIPGKQDIAGIKKKPTHMLIYFVKENNQVTRIIFPILGKGLWSTLYGFMALDKDLKTVAGITFYEHGETPGLGGEVDNKRWKASWKGKLAFDDSGNWSLNVLKGVAGQGSRTDIDGLSGATITTRGVNNLVKFWFGPDGYGPYLEKLRKEGLQ